MDNQVSKKIQKFFEQYKAQKFKKGDILIRADDTPSGVFYIKKGAVRRYSISNNGTEVILNIYKNPAFFPMSWVLNGITSSHYFEALTSLETYKAPKEDVFQFVKNNPDVQFDLLQRMYRGFEGVFMRMEYLMVGSAYTRLIAELIIHAKRFGDKLNTKNKSLTFQLTQKILSSQTGIARETVSREMHKLMLKGLIKFDNRQITIPELENLENELLESE